MSYHDTHECAGTPAERETPDEPVPLPETDTVAMPEAMVASAIQAAMLEFQPPLGESLCLLLPIIICRITHAICHHLQDQIKLDLTCQVIEPMHMQPRRPRACGLLKVRHEQHESLYLAASQMSRAALIVQGTECLTTQVVLFLHFWWLVQNACYVCTAILHLHLLCRRVAKAAT